MKYQRGQATVEFAFAGIIFILLLIGVTDVGRALYAYNTIHNAARIGTRYAIVRGTTCGYTTPASPSPIPCNATSTSIATYVQSKTPGIGITTADIATTPTTIGAPGSLVTVTITYPFKFLAYPHTTTMHSQSQNFVVQ